MKRPYKEAWTSERALDQIRSLSGSHLDPQVVEAFFSCMDDVLTVQGKYQDPPRAVSYLAQVAGAAAQ